MEVGNSLLDIYVQYIKKKSSFHTFDFFFDFSWKCILGNNLIKSKYSKWRNTLADKITIKIVYVLL